MRGGGAEVHVTLNLHTSKFHFKPSLCECSSPRKDLRLASLLASGKSIPLIHAEEAHLVLPGKGTSSSHPHKHTQEAVTVLALRLQLRLRFCCAFVPLRRAPIQSLTGTTKSRGKRSLHRRMLCSFLMAVSGSTTSQRPNAPAHKHADCRSYRGMSGGIVLQNLASGKLCEWGRLWPSMATHSSGLFFAYVTVFFA